MHLGSTDRAMQTYVGPQDKTKYAGAWAYWAPLRAGPAGSLGVLLALKHVGHLMCSSVACAIRAAGWRSHCVSCTMAPCRAARARMAGGGGGGAGLIHTRTHTSAYGIYTCRSPDVFQRGLRHPDGGVKVALHGVLPGADTRGAGPHGWRRRRRRGGVDTRTHVGKHIHIRMYTQSKQRHTQIYIITHTLLNI